MQTELVQSKLEDVDIHGRDCISRVGIKPVLLLFIYRAIYKLLIAAAE